jgi:hypothetical protein
LLSEASAVNSTARTLIVACLTFASALVGFLLQRLLPVQYLTDAKGTVGSITGLVILLLALVRGLLVWTSYGVYTTQNTESQALGPTILQLDFALERYGPDARAGRELLRKAVVRARERLWGGKSDGVAPYTQARADLKDIAAFFAGLEPANDEQRDDLIATAKPIFAQVVQTTLLMSRQLASPVPSLLLVVVVGWSELLFLGFGLLGAFNAVSVAAAALGSIAVASAIFMILEFSQPYSGLFKISPVGVDNLIAVLGR